MTSVNVTRFFSCFPAQSSLSPTVISYTISTCVRRGKGKTLSLISFVVPLLFLSPSHAVNTLPSSYGIFGIIFHGKTAPFRCESCLPFLCYVVECDDNPLTRCHFNGVQRPRREFLTFTFGRPLCAGDVPVRSPGNV